MFIAVNKGAEAVPVLYLRFSPPWDALDDVRRFVEAFCLFAKVHAGREQQIGLAAHELLQNALAYSDDGAAELLITIDQAHDCIRMAVTNRVGDAEAKRLEAAVAFATFGDDPLATFLRAMASCDTRSEVRAGLGLARVRFEAGLSLGMRMNDDSRVTVEAFGPLSDAGEHNGVHAG